MCEKEIVPSFPKTGAYAKNAVPNPNARLVLHNMPLTGLHMHHHDDLFRELCMPPPLIIYETSALLQIMLEFLQMLARIPRRARDQLVRSRLTVGGSKCVAPTSLAL